MSAKLPKSKKSTKPVLPASLPAPLPAPVPRREQPEEWECLRCHTAGVFTPTDHVRKSKSVGGAASIAHYREHRQCKARKAIQNKHGVWVLR